MSGRHTQAVTFGRLAARLVRPVCSSNTVQSAFQLLSYFGVVCPPSSMQDRNLQRAVLNTAHSCMYAGRRTLVVRSGDKTTTLEIWSSTRLLCELSVPASVHGGVCNDGWFATGAAWSPDESRLAYVAEVLHPPNPLLQHDMACQTQQALTECLVAPLQPMLVMCDSAGEAYVRKSTETQTIPLPHLAVAASLELCH